MARSKKPVERKEKKRPVPKAPKTKLVQARIPAQEHELLVSMSRLFGSPLAQRLGTIIHNELEGVYPMAFVEFGGVAHQTWLLIEKHEVPVMNECLVAVAPEYAKGIFPEAMHRDVRSEVRVTMPRRTPGIFAITSNYYQDTDGVWHIQLLRIGQVPA